MADQSFTVFGKSLRENDESVLILDDLDFNLTAPPSATTIEGTIDAIQRHACSMRRRPGVGSIKPNLPREVIRPPRAPSVGRS